MGYGLRHSHLVLLVHRRLLKIQTIVWNQTYPDSTMLNALGKDRDSATPQREGVKCQISFPV